jgi:hypothetical protein
MSGQTFGVAIAVLGVLATVVAGSNHFRGRNAALGLIGVAAIVVGSITVISSRSDGPPAPTTTEAATTQSQAPQAEVLSGTGNKLPLVPNTPDLRHIDLREWCIFVGAGPTVDPVPAQQPGALGKWRCRNGRQIDWQAACDYWYSPAGSTEPVAITHDDSAGGRCRDK